MKKTAIGILLCVCLANLAGAQSVAELARRQKARRAALKGKPAAVVTNKELAKVKRTPALVIQTPVELTAENVEAATVAETPPGTEGVEPAAGTPAAATPPAAESAPPAAPAEAGALTESQYTERRDALNAAANRAQEYADLLQLRLGQLWQQYYNLDDMAPKDAIKAQISEVYTKMQLAQEDALKAKAELETFLATAKREGTPSIWIK
jgi:hypothetical protein